MIEPSLNRNCKEILGAMLGENIGYQLLENLRILGIVGEKWRTRIPEMAQNSGATSANKKKDEGLGPVPD